MESKHIQRVTFAELADAKSVMVLVSNDFNQKGRAYEMMRAIGVRPNSGAMAEARRDVTAPGELLLAVTAEFRRLHVDCPCSTTDDEIREGEESIKVKLQEIKAEADKAGPTDDNPEHAAEDLLKFLGATGIPVPEGFDASQLPGLSSGNEGTGMYL
jgi:hypothetical protein